VQEEIQDFMIIELGKYNSAKELLIESNSGRVARTVNFRARAGGYL